MKISVIKEKILKIEIEKIVVFYNFSTKCETIPKCDIFIDPYGFRCKKTDDNVFLIDSPGEYEIKDLFIKGKNITGPDKNEQDSPTTYLLKYDQVKLLICDKIRDKKTTVENLKNFVPEADVVVVIIGEKNFLSPTQGQTLSRAFSPSIIAPVSIDNSKKHLNAFVSAGGGQEESQKFLKLKKKNLISGESKVVLLQ